MVISQIIRIGYYAGKQFIKLNKAEKKLFDYAYTGYPSGFGRGARHGTVLGQIAGTLLQEDDGLESDNGFPQTFQPKPQAHKQYKTYSRQPGRYSRKYKNKCPPNYRRRQSSYY